ncbi:cache domain-containing protein [Thiomicrorhabdus chilensis]|uniref:cache domain-containing protein n=1 Tax=Thiomicrorhabdus chilensis TaxID=63656 RepID=UPI00040AD3FA|nr:cache domain-containing protein [Thiomicrorhabdus chilensis]
MQHQQDSRSYREFIQYLPEVKRYLSELEHQDLWWTTVAMVGKINNENIDPQLLESIVDTQKEFQNLRDIMIEGLIGRYLNQANSEIMLKAQAVIDILIRNLFERTADVGFLATDNDLVDFMASDDVSEETKGFIHRRIEEYVAKYTVYDDVLLVSPEGKVRAKLDESNPVEKSFDPLIQQALTTDEEYVEVYRHSDLFPGKPASLIYAKRIEAEVSGQLRVVGVLCLSFNFEDEVERLFKVLNNEQDGYGVMLVDDSGKVLVANHPEKYPVGKQQACQYGMKEPVRSGNNLYFATKTNGYQGFYGLPWLGYVDVPSEVAFDDKSSKKEINVTIPKDSPLYLRDLEETNLKVSTLLLIVILNGKILSIKRDVKAFLPILDSFQDISVDIQEIFKGFIHHIHQVLVKTIQGKVAFSAALAVEVMDRNLYERANDCRWWALNSTFRQILTEHKQTQAISAEQVERLTEVLAYINKLYTVYTNIMLYDHKGKVLAVSNPAESELVGTLLPRPNDTARCLSLSDTQAYVVSDFHQTDLYSGRHTYIYHAAVKEWGNLQKNVGGIALVFDSEPEFAAMLEETQPKYINNLINDTTFSVFVDRSGLVISSTLPDLSVGTQFEVPAEVLEAESGQNDTVYWEWRSQPYLVGYRVSEGYREYKNGDGYENDVIALVLTGI